MHLVLHLLLLLHLVCSITHEKPMDGFQLLRRVADSRCHGLQLGLLGLRRCHGLQGGLLATTTRETGLGLRMWHGLQGGMLGLRMWHGLQGGLLGLRTCNGLRKGGSKSDRL